MVGHNEFVCLHIIWHRIALHCIAYEASLRVCFECSRMDIGEDSIVSMTPEPKPKPENGNDSAQTQDRHQGVHAAGVGRRRRENSKGEKKEEKRRTVNSLVLCRLSISSTLSLTLSNESSNPSSSTTSRAARRSNSESGVTSWLIYGVAF